MRSSDWSSDVCSSELYTNEAVRDCTGERHCGLLRLSDMASWEASYEEPVVADYGRYTVAKCGPWSQGPVFLQQLAMLKHTDIVSHASDSAAFVHGIAEIAKLAMADRLAWYGDPAGVNVPLAALLSDDYAKTRIQALGALASKTLNPGSPQGFTPAMPDLLASARALAEIGRAWCRERVCQ